MAKKAQVVELPSREELVQLAQEVNAVLNLEVAIKFGKKVTDEELAAAIVKECKNNVYEIDFIEDEEDPSIPIYSEEAKETFETLGIKILAGSPPAGDSKSEDADEPEEDEVPEPAQTKTKKEKATPAAKAEAAPAKVKAAAKAKDKIYTRWDAFADVVKSGKKISIADLATKADALCVKNGKASNMNEAKKCVDLGIKIAVALGHGTVEGKDFTYNA